MMCLKGEGLTFITCALHETTHNKFWLFERSPELDKALSKIVKQIKKGD